MFEGWTDTDATDPQEFPLIRQKERSNGVASLFQLIGDRLEKERQQYLVARLTILNEIGRAMLMAQSPIEVVQTALRYSQQLVPYQQARLTLFDVELNGFITLLANADGQTRLHKNRSFSWATYTHQRLDQHATTILVEDLAEIAQPSPLQQQLLRVGMRSCIDVPLMAEGEPVGLFVLGSRRPNSFKSIHSDFIQELATALALVIWQAQLRGEVRRTRMKLQAALRAKEEMIQNVSHELRTPLSVIQGYTRLLQQGILGPLNDDQEEALVILERENERLDYMISRLLTLQTLDPGALAKVPVTLQGLLQQTVQAWQTRAAHINVEFRLTLPANELLLMADPELLQQVIHNLLDNAVKFSPQGGLINICTWIGNNEAVLAISDQGIGMSIQDLSHIFEQFYQVDGSTTRTVGGMGIGLALCRAIVEAHGGRLWAESAGEGHGSTFFMTLPIEEPPA